MNYLDAGFNEDLLRPVEADYTEQAGLDSSAAFEQISGLQVRGDQITSLNQSLVLDLENDSFVVRDGEIKRVELGKLSDGTIGMILRDSDGNVLFNISSSGNKITSPSGNFEIDFNEERLIVYDEGKIPRVLIGKQVGGF